MTQMPNNVGGPTPPPPPPPSPAPVAPGGPQLVGPETSDARTMGMLCHLLVIFTGFVGPLIIWLIKKDQSPFVNQQGKEALNWALTLLILAVGMVFIAMIPILGWVIGCLGWVVYAGSNITFGILSTIAVNKGQPYRYPVCIRFIK